MTDARLDEAELDGVAGGTEYIIMIGAVSTEPHQQMAGILVTEGSKVHAAKHRR